MVDKDTLQRYLADTCTEEERAMVEAWFEQYSYTDIPLSDEELRKMVKSLDKRMKRSPKVISFKDWKVWLAAAVCLFIGFKLSNIFLKGDKGSQPDIESIKAPTSANAVIVLGDSLEIDVDHLRIGDTLLAAGYLLTKLENGDIFYIKDKEVEGSVTYNTLRTRSGGIASVKLSDGSVVWLNSNSELIYPVTFESEKREVFLRGEGYFEIEEKHYSSNEKVPFFVRGDHQTIKVLGTKFNANFNRDRETALIEGIVAISNRGTELETEVEPSYDVVMDRGQLFDGSKLVFIENIERFIDWKEGYFDLNDLTLIKLADKLSNWYGVEVVVDKGLEDVELFGRVSRKRDLHEVLSLVSHAAAISYDLNKNQVKITKGDN